MDIRLSTLLKDAARGWGIRSIQMRPGTCPIASCWLLVCVSNLSVPADRPPPTYSLRLSELAGSQVFRPGASAPERLNEL